ncbi:MAG: Uma2 family endonuclease [Byssovorax sp.]
MRMSSAARSPVAPRRATYAEFEAVPPNKVAELIRGALHVMPRPALRHAKASSRLTMKLGGPFDLGDGGPGGWLILDEPELHFPDPTEPGESDVLVPDLAGWKRDRVPDLPDTAFATIAPDWICEVLSPSTKDFDRDEKMPVYAREGVLWAWLIDPIAKVLEVYVLDAGGSWGEPAIFRGAEVVRAVPFDAIELDLSALWA